MKFSSDVDIDVSNRDEVLKLISCTGATQLVKNQVRRHPSGIYVTDIPYDPVKNTASIDYQVAEERGYVKLDLLNVGVYNDVKDENHLIELMSEPDWSLLKNRKFVESIVHINKYFDTIQTLPEPINSVARMAMFLAVIRPGKKHLIGKTWREIAETIWEVSEDGFVFKRSHSIAYSNLVIVDINLKSAKLRASSSPK